MIVPNRYNGHGRYFLMRCFKIKRFELLSNKIFGQFTLKYLFKRWNSNLKLSQNCAWFQYLISKYLLKFWKPMKFSNEMFFFIVYELLFTCFSNTGIIKYRICFNIIQKIKLIIFRFQEVLIITGECLLWKDFIKYGNYTFSDNYYIFMNEKYVYRRHKMISLNVRKISGRLEDFCNIKIAIFVLLNVSCF